MEEAIDISKNTEALNAINEILSEGKCAEIKVEWNGTIIVSQSLRKVKYRQKVK